MAITTTAADAAANTVAADVTAVYDGHAHRPG